MSAYDDVKKAIQEFLAPEISVLKERIDQNERRAQERHETLMREIAWRFESLKDSLELHKRVDSLERHQGQRHEKGQAQ